MDDENQECQEGPFAVWQMFNAPTMVLFNNLESAEDGLDRLLTSIIKLSGDFSEVLTSRPGNAKYPDTYYGSFNTWLLGRLFYLWSVKQLERIHIPSKEAQLKVLNILCYNSASFYEKLHTEYFSMLEKLVKYYHDSINDNKPADLLLENFVPSLVQIPDVNAQLNFEPIFVQVKDLKTCETLMCLILQLLSESMPVNSVHLDGCMEAYKKVFQHILYIMENYGTDLKMESLKFFANYIHRNNIVGVISFCQNFPITFKKLLLGTEALFKSMGVLFETGEASDFTLDNFCKSAMIILQMAEENMTDRIKNIIQTISAVVLGAKNKIFSKALRLLCLSMSNTLELPKDLISIQNMDSSEIEALNKCYCQNILAALKSDKESISDNWYYSQVLTVVDSLKFCDDVKDFSLCCHHLERTAAALKILSNVAMEKKKDYCRDTRQINGHNEMNGHNIDCDDHEDLLKKDLILRIWENLTTIIKQHNLLKDNYWSSSDVDSVSLIMETALSAVTLCQDIKKDDIDIILQIICLQNTHEFTENNINNLHDIIKATVLKYLLMGKVVLKTVPETWNKLIALLVSSLIKEKSCGGYQNILSLTPLLLLTKHYSSSKVIGEILMPAFMTKNAEVEQELLNVIPAITCITLGAYNIILKPTDDNFGHDIFRNNITAASVVCPQCHIEGNQTTEEIVSKLNKQYSILKQHSKTGPTSSESTTNSLKKLLTKFLNKSQYINIEETEYWRALGRLCNHYYVFDYGISADVASIENCKQVIKALKPYLDGTTDRDAEKNSHKQQAFNLCVNLLVKSTRSLLENCNFSQSAAVLRNIKEFGELRNKNVILPATKLLVYFIVHPQYSYSPLATVYLREICENHGYTPNEVYHRYKNDYCKLFVECSLYSGKEFAICLLKVVKAFGFVGYRDFISKDVHHFLPYLMPYAITVKEVPLMIEEVASLVQSSVSNFLIERFPHIYVHVYMNEDNEVANKCFNIIEKLTKMSILNLIKKHFRVILTEFLLQYCCDPEKVLNACRYLACHDPDVSTPSGSMSMSTSQIADFLHPKFLGILAYFDHKLVNTKVALSVKRKALTSFPDIMQLMGVKYLTPLRFKVLATLRSALPLTSEFPKIVAESWGAFIHNIDSMFLGPLLPNLAVSLLRQYEYAPQEINSIFQFLILSNENLLSSHISELFFLSDTKISEKIKMVVKKHVKRTQPDCFVDKVKWYLHHLNQEIPIIKACAYAQLDKLLKTHRNDIHKAIFAGKSIDPVIVELIDFLLIGCKDPDPQVSTASGACLGQLGAIEAGHLPRQYVQPDRSPFAFSIADNCFAATALMELARAFQYEKDTKNMDCYALTIQEILKIYDISPTGGKKEVWDSFPEHLHQIMSPLLSSRYTLAYPSQPKKAHPLFGSAHATTFLEWAHNWAGQLIPLIETESIRELLRTVHPSMRRDVRTLFLFLPYVLLHAIMARSNNQFIEDEIMAVISLESIERDSMITLDKQKYKMLRHVQMVPTIHTAHIEEGSQSKCRKTVYTLFDFLNRWILEWCHSKQRPTESEVYKAISSFMDKFDKLMIARGNFACGELERALQYLELYMEENKSSMHQQLPLLAEIYALLDEPDSVAGILSIKRSEPSLKELILAQVVTGRLQDAALCYERLAQERQLDKHSLQGMIECYLGLDQPFTAYRLLSEQESDDSVTELAAEPLWRLGRFEQLEKLADKTEVQNRENWGLLMGRVLLSYRSQDVQVFTTSCKDATSRLLTEMDGEAKGESALRSGYQSILGLHIVAEAGHAMDVLRNLKSLSDGDKRSTDILSQLLVEWRRRLAVVQSDVRTIEPLLRLRRILLQQTQELLRPSHPLTASRLKSFIGELWLQSAKHARKAGILQQSYMYILNAEEYRPEELFIQKAKMYWARGQNEHAFTTLRRGLEDSYPQMELLTQEQRKICAKAKLLIAKYNDETTSVGVDVNIGYYKEAVEAFKQWEKSLVSLGAYFEKVTDDSSNNDLMWSRRLYAMNSYGKALQYGHKYLYQSMPRMLSIWLGVEVTSNDTKVHAILAQMTEVIKTYSERLPLYLYLTAFSQIVSRICHPVKEVYQQLKAIIVKLILAYPQHTLWMMMSVIKSSYPQRIKRCSEVFADPRLKEPRMLKLLCDFTQLAEKLIELCNKPIAGCGMTTTVSSLVRTLPRLLSDENFSRIMMPFEEFCKVVLPSKAAGEDRVDYTMPAEPPVYISGIEEQITILPSLQKPRKVTLKGSNGISYIILLKPRDDLRKDYRLMEFNGVVNRFLQDAPETRRRRLYIRTYSVLPLNEECGLIEWVPNLVGLRPVLLHIYKQKGIHTSNRELKEMMCSNKDPVEKKRRVFEEQLLPRHPPVFQEWFRRVFSDPYGWYQARSAYIRTTAVMSMVGYILGLGDRHGENISFDSTNGDTVHVDFNCLFNKGEAFEWPERVPFRLTHNMEAAMGPLKHEGMYRKSCEAVMRALREQTAALMSVIGPFVYDPLVAWGRGRPVESGERTNEQALQHLEHIRQRLNGMVRTKNKTLSLSLSPEGQVEHLIVEATSIHNLCQMYIGWGPFL